MKRERGAMRKHHSSVYSYPQGESNSYLRFRKPLFYPLNYEGGPAHTGSTHIREAKVVKTSHATRFFHNKSHCDTANTGIKGENLAFFFEESRKNNSFAV